MAERNLERSSEEITEEDGNVKRSTGDAQETSTPKLGENLTNGQMAMLLQVLLEIKQTTQELKEAREKDKQERKEKREKDKQERKEKREKDKQELKEDMVKMDNKIEQIIRGNEKMDSKLEKLNQNVIEVKQEIQNVRRDMKIIEDRWETKIEEIKEEETLELEENLGEEQKEVTEEDIYEVIEEMMPDEDEPKEIHVEKVGIELNKNEFNLDENFDRFDNDIKIDTSQRYLKQNIKENKIALSWGKYFQYKETGNNNNKIKGLGKGIIFLNPFQRYIEERIKYLRSISQKEKIILGKEWGTFWIKIFR